MLILVAVVIEGDAKALCCTMPLQPMTPRAQAKAKHALTVLLELLLSPSFFFEGNENPSNLQVIERRICKTAWPVEPLGNERGKEAKRRLFLFILAALTGGSARS